MSHRSAIIAGMRRAAYPVFERQDGVASRAQLLRAGLTPGEIAGAIRRRAILVVHPGVYRLAGAPVTPLSRLIAATLARPGAVVSHESAGALWGLLPCHPDVPRLSIDRARRAPGGDEVVVHRPTDLPTLAVSNWQGFSCTNPLRTVVDLATLLDDAALDDVVDGALQLGLVGPAALMAEAERIRRRGRAGSRAVIGSLTRRGLIGAPRPSVLESRVLRLLAGGGIVPLGAEVPPDDVQGRYRLDFLLSPAVALEVDGYAHHARAADLRRDLRRMNDLQLSGLLVLRFTWWDVCHDGARVLAEVRRALAKRATPPSAA